MSDKALPLFPRFLNEPEKIVRWSINEVMVFALPTVFVSIIGLGLLGVLSIPLGLTLGYCFFKTYRFLSNTRYGDLKMSLLYWYLPSKGFSPFPPSHIREYIG